MSKVKCNDCTWTGEDRGIETIKHLSERVDANEPMPSCECPKCGALCYEPPQQSEREREMERVLRQVLNVISTLQEPEGCEDYLNSSSEERTVRPQQVFGVINEEFVELLEWPDLAWAKDQIVKVLGS